MKKNEQVTSRANDDAVATRRSSGETPRRS